MKERVRTVNNYSSEDDWFADKDGIRSQFENDFKLFGHKIAYQNSFPGIPYTSVQSWFNRIGYDFHSLEKLPGFRSNREFEVEGWLCSLGLQVQHASAFSVISGYELDLWLPDHKIAIELNGFLYHTSVEQLSKDGNHFAGGFKYTTLHKTKTDLCLSKGILPFQFWLEDKQGSKPSFIIQLKSFILYQLGSPLVTERPLLESPFAPVENEPGYCYINRDLSPKRPPDAIDYVEGVYTHPQYGTCYNSGFWKCPLTE